MTTMGAAVAAEPQAADAVLAMLRNEDCLPVELMDRLEKQKQLSDAVLKAAILDLLQQRRIEFGPDQKLRLVAL
ncbi:MAG TPA: hypothetical protein VFW94_10675 [Candidatus Acidoferrales bacterium]|nr:hypothetical protein [Candidatus Acidoferrales bacterium]